MVEEFKKAFLNRNQLAEERKKGGQRVIGWMCIYVPEELFMAAGMLPIRIFGGAEKTPRADAHMYSNTCSFVRSCLEEALEGRYSFLDGLATANTCDHIRRLYDVWAYYQKLPFMHVMDLPQKATDEALQRYLEQVRQLKDSLERTFDVQITDQALGEAIETCNLTRTLLHRLYELRRADPPPITGAEVMEVIRAAMVLPKEEFNGMLEQFLETLPTAAPGTSNENVRLFITGSELDQPEYIALIEELGGLIVADDLCNGSRYFWDLVEPKGDPLEALARRYLTHSPCPRIQPATLRSDHIRKMVQEFGVQGVIHETIKFCDLYGMDYPLSRELFSELGLPLLPLNREYALAGIGQMKTRVQAFLESFDT
jgi:bzd-type benzoyl-CoA reductase N subunit